jgi:hypothetical protein
MSKSSNNPILQKHSGMLGNLVIRQVNGRTIISTRPKKRDVPTDHQLKTKARFMLAVDFAKRQMADAGIKAQYQKAAVRNIPNAYTAALKDFLNKPTVTLVDVKDYTGAIGSVIHVKAQDDFEVVSVRVDIYDAANALLESGYAAPNEKRNGWSYAVGKLNVPTAGSRIVVKAKDRPKNEGVKEVVIG